MDANDERHGTTAGYAAHYRAGTHPCEPCTRAHARKRKMNRLRAYAGTPGLIPERGTTRRIHALQALGYSHADIAAAGGIGESPVRDYRGNYVQRRTAEAVERAYEALCMTPKPGAYAERSRRIARRKGYAPPLAWDDIDNDPAPATTDPEDAVDEVVVQRLLDGQRVRSTRAEKVAAIERWKAQGRPLAELERRSGINANRYRGVAA